MANTILIKRGTKENLSLMTLLPGELGVVLDTQELYVGDAEGNKQLIKGGAAGSVESAAKLTTARNIAINGDATGSTSFDGSQDVQIALALANSGVSAGTYTKVSVDEKGRVTVGSNLSKEDLPTITVEDIEGLNTTLESKADKSTTYTKDEVNNLVNGKANTTHTHAISDVTDLQTTLDGLVTTTELNEEVSTINSSIAEKADASDVTALTSIVGANETNITNLQSTKADKSTTLTGYGITDAYTKTEVDAKVASVYRFKGSVANEEALPSEGMVVGDVYNLEDTEMNVAWDGENWDKLGTSVDLTPYLTKTEATSTYATITTVNGKADKASTLAGYTITDAYTKTEVDNIQNTLQTNIGNKANSADVYTKTEVDNKLSGKLGTSDVIDGGTF